MTSEEIRALRKQLNLTQAEMGRRLGVGWRMYAYIEVGKKPLSKASEILAQQLKNSLDGG